jgi:hypothetical protein
MAGRPWSAQRRRARCPTRSFEDPGWYENPAGTLAGEALAEDLQRDGMDPESPPAAEDDPTAKYKPA